MVRPASFTMIVTPPTHSAVSWLPDRPGATNPARPVGRAGPSGSDHEGGTRRRRASSLSKLWSTTGAG